MNEEIKAMHRLLHTGRLDQQEKLIWRRITKRRMPEMARTTHDVYRALLRVCKHPKNAIVGKDCTLRKI
jgi:hypothetical protein